MSTTHCETGIVRIRVGLFNDILRFVRALCIILYGESYYFIFNCKGSLYPRGEARGSGSSLPLPPPPSVATVSNVKVRFSLELDLSGEIRFIFKCTC